MGGDEPSLLEGSALDRPLHLALVSVLEEESFLYLRYRLLYDSAQWQRNSVTGRDRQPDDAER